jgi:Transcriptional regulator
MRISREEKELLREKILTKAIESFKVHGAAGAPVDKIMKSVGLTSGALYSHFESKEDFFHQVVAKELENLTAKYNAGIEERGPKALMEFIDTYLSMAHVDGVGKGCVFASLGSDMQRQKASIRADFEEKIQTLFRTLARGLSQGSEKERIEKVEFIYSSMVGAMTYARAMKSSTAATQFLSATKKQLIKILDL